MSNLQASDGSPLEILIAEDSPTQARQLQHMLEQHGYQVTAAGNGRLALEAARRRKPALVISDVVMPEMTGYELCHAIKTDAALADVPVILVTTMSEPEDVIRGLECRADNFILKPYEERYLMGRVQFVLLNREMRQADYPGMALEILFSGQKHYITADRLQILNLLLSTYDAAMHRNRELSSTQDKLREANSGLRELTVELENRVARRTEELARSNESLQEEIGVRRLAEQKLKAQLTRLDLLGRTTRAIAERQDLESIFHVVLRRLEDDLQVDYGCVCLGGLGEAPLTVTAIGRRDAAPEPQPPLAEHEVIAVDRNGLARCLQGQLVYEPDVSGIHYPFPQRLAAGGLRSMVIAPLLVEERVFGVIVAARAEAHSFSSGECEFLRQLSEHVALASNQARLHAELQQAYDDLRRTQQTVMQQERLRALGQMASGIAHDINNAISPVALYTESLLEREPGLSPRGRNYLETIQHAIDDVTATVARMREFYRQREDEIAMTPIGLNRLVQQVLDLTRVRWNDMPQQRGAMIRLQTELLPEIPPVMGVEGEIRDALTNLILNAVDAMPEDGTLILRTRLVPKEGDGTPAVAVEVSDTGIGMSEETRRRCLEPFFTTKGDRGTGLGLAMVYGTVERHKAAIEIDSAPGQGTTIRLIFAAADPNALTPTSIFLTPDSLSQLRLLIVDDDPLLIKSLRDILEVEGHSVFAADGGQAGIDAFLGSREKGEPFDVVITDLGMPYVDGRKVAAAIKAASPATPVIMLTGWGERMVAEGEVPPHVDRVLSKPPKLREINHALSVVTRMQLLAK